MTFLANAPTSTMATAVDASPRPGMRRPRRRSYKGVVNPSTSPNTQISAAMLMKTGTVTKKPVTKLRRSHCIDQAPVECAMPTVCRTEDSALQPEAPSQDGEAKRDAIPRKRRESGPADVIQKRLHHQGRRQERHDEANRDLQGAPGSEAVAGLEQIVR